MSRSDEHGGAAWKASAEFLRRGLALGDGFAFYVVAAEQLATREALVRALSEDPLLALARVDVAELEDAAIDRPIAAAQQTLVADDLRHVVLVTGLEELAERVPELMARLNEYRNELRARIDGVMLWLGSPMLLALVQHQAPDVWSARAADLELAEGPPPRLPPPPRPSAESGATEDLVKWQHTLDELPQGPRRGRLAMALADAILEPGEEERVQRARALYEQAAQELDEPAERTLALVRAATLEDPSLGDHALRAARAGIRQLDEGAVEPGLAARAWSELARVCQARGYFDEAEEASIHALHLAERLGADAGRAEILAERAEQLTSRGGLVEALAVWDEMLSLPLSMPARSNALVRAGITAALAGRRDRLGRYWRRYLAEGGPRQRLDAVIDQLEPSAASLAREVLASPAPARSMGFPKPTFVYAPLHHDHSREPDLGGAVVMSPRGGYQLIKLPGGRFLMGSPEHEPGHRDSEGPQRWVDLAGFYLGRCPVTNAQYYEFLRCNPEVEAPRHWGEPRFADPRQPVIGLSWWDARGYCEWAGLSLPTEAQWEYACRAGTITRYWSGDGEEDLARIAWYGEDPMTGATHPVGEKAPNPFGLHDMHGNVYEWCEDAWTETLLGELRPGDGLRAQPLGTRWRIVRGGSWIMPALGARSAYRYGRLPHYRSFDLGFRPALPIPFTVELP